MHDYIADARVPAGYRELTPDSLTVRHGLTFDVDLVKALFSKNYIACVTGPVYSGKTSVLATIANYGLGLSIAYEQQTGGETSNDRLLYLEAPRAMRSLRKLSAKEDKKDRIYRVSTLILDDLDKVEIAYRPLARDVIVHRQQEGLKTLISVTNPVTLREFDPQLYVRIENGHQVHLQSNRPNGTMRPDGLPLRSQDVVLDPGCEIE